MSWNSRIKLEPRGDEDPKFDPNNKTDRKIIRVIVITVVVLLLLIGGIFFVYFMFFHK